MWAGMCVLIQLVQRALQQPDHPMERQTQQGRRPTWWSATAGGPAGFNRTWVRLTYRLGGPSAGRPKGRFNPSPPLGSVATAGVMLFKGPQARQYTQKAVHTQGGTHKRRSVATAGVMLLKGPQARQYTLKAVRTQGGTHKRRSVATAGVMLLKGPQARR